ncbi:MAG: beta strand repeat-containing protein, partial [Acidobacteriota bacterium]
SDNDLYVQDVLEVDGATYLTPSGSADVTIATDSDSTLEITGLQQASGSLLCLDGSNTVVTCDASSQSLQTSYDNGNTIDTSNNRDIAFTLSNTATDANFTVTTSSDSTGQTVFQLADGSGTSTPNELVSIENADTNLALPTALRIQSESGGITTALDVSDAEIGTALATGANDLSGTNWSITGTSGNINSAGDIAVNGGDLTTTAGTASLFNTNATTLNIGGAATSLTIGANNDGATTIKNATVTLSTASTFNAMSATAGFDTINVGNGYGSTGVTLSNTGTIQANGNLTIGGSSTLTGDVTAAGDLTVNGGDLTTTAGTASLFNTSATTLNIGGAATTIAIGADTGTTTVNNNLTVTTGDTFNANGAVSLNPNSTNDVVITTDADSTLQITGLQSDTGSQLCLTASNAMVTCDANSAGLQAAYDSGNTITTTNNRDIAFTLDDTTTDSNFSVTTATDATGYSVFARSNGVGSADPAQLVLIENQDTDRAQPIGLKVQAAAGGITTGIDLSDADLVTALSLGDNDVSATNFSITGANGNITTSGDVAVNGGDLTSSQSTFNLVNSGVTTLNVGGASTSLVLGATTGSTTIRNTTLSLPNATAITAGGAALTIDSLSTGGGYGSTGMT